MSWLVWWWFENSRACLYYLLVNYCQFIVSLTDCGVPERWLNDGEVFCWDVLSLKNVSSFSFILEPFVGSSLKFFVEGSILAQDERWRRA